jgi:two-component system OmpR family response regulator
MVYSPALPDGSKRAERSYPLTTVESSFQYRGDLAQTALPEILHTIDRFQVPGVIEAQRQGVAKRVFIKEGNVVHAASSDREDSLGRYLEVSGMLSREDVAATMRERERSNKRYGELLIEQGLLSPAELYRAIRKQIEAIVWSLFYWQDGSVSFSIGDFRETDSVRIQLPMRQVILQGIKRAPSAKTMVARLGRKETMLEPCYRIEELIELAIDADELRLLQLVDGRRTLYDICTQGPHSAADNGKLLYAYQVLQLIRRLQVGPAGDPDPDREAGRERLQEPRRQGVSSGAIKIRFKTQGDKYGA